MFLDAKDLCQSLKTLFVITPESSFLTVPLDRDRSNLKLLQKSVGAEVVSFHPINGGNFDGWLLVINDYAEGTENRMITELVGSPFTIKGRAILAPPRRYRLKRRLCSASTEPCSLKRCC